MVDVDDHGPSFNTTTARAKARPLRNHPRVSLLVVTVRIHPEHVEEYGLE